jgi:F-type H+-transporting ATPase subunit a
MNTFATIALRAAEEGKGVEFGSKTLFYLGPIRVSDVIFSAWVAMAVLMLLVFLSTRNMKMVPTGLQNLMETVVEALMGIIDQTAGPRGRQFAPLVLAAFLFILTANWIGITPFFGNMAGFVSPNKNLNVTAAMAIVVFFVVQYFAIKTLGVGGWVKEFFVPNPLHLLSEISRPLSLSLRLFGNIFAGSTLVHQILGLAPYATFVFLGLELFVGAVQALIFTMLTLVFLSIATAGHGHGEGHGHAEAHSQEAHAASHH